MADIRAFRAYRYDLGRVGSLGDVIAPPYDVIDPALQQTLYERSPYNVIRLILNRDEPGTADPDARYTRASRHLRAWLHDGILAHDSARSLYVYHQEFEVEGQRHVRRGFLARVRLEPFGAGKIYPHEETLPGPKADRLKLFRATHMNLSPVFGLYPDETGTVQGQLDAAVGRALPLEAADHLGVVSRLWPVSDQHVVSAVTGLLGPRPVFIADGHHRYETALRYLEERRQAGAVHDEESAPNFVLMMLVSMSDPGLVILPTHRLVSGLPSLTADQLSKLLEKHFQLETVGQGEAGARAAWELIEADGSQDVLGFGTGADGTWQLARLREPRVLAPQHKPTPQAEACDYISPQVMGVLAPQHSPTWRGLAVSVLHELVLGKLLSEGLTAQPRCRYVHLLSEVLDATARKECQLAVLVPPAAMRHVEQIAGNLERMPPKSTYFYPKLLSGLVFNPLTGS